jgi:serine protease Do
LGVAVAAIDQERAAQLKLNDGEGVWITWVEDDSPAARAGLKGNDVLLNYNGESIGDPDLLGRLVRATPLRAALSSRAPVLGQWTRYRPG